MSPTFEAHIPMVTFALKTGRRVALPYFSLARVDFDPSLQAVELSFGMVVVELLGRGLLPLYESVSAHLAVEVAEATAPEGQLLPVTQCVVERVTLRAV